MPASRRAGLLLPALVGLALLGGAGCLRAPAVPDIGVSRGPPLQRAVYSVDWWTQLVPDRLLEYAPREPATPALDAENKRLVVGTRDGKLRSVGEGGAVAWTFTTHGPFEAGPTVHEGTVYAACADGVLYALDAKTGAQKWKYDAKEELVSQPVVAAGKVLVAASSDVVFAVDAKTGEWSWQYRRDTPSGFTIRGAARPVAQGDTAYAGFSDGQLVALHVSDGSVKWEKALSKPGQYVDVDTSPLLDGEGGIYAASYKDGLYALDAETGAVKWQSNTGGLVHLSAAGQLLVGAGDQEVCAFDRLTGKKLWTRVVKNTAARLAAVVRGYLVVPANDALLFINPIDGRTEISWDPGQGVTATPLVRGPHVYVLSNLGFLYALRLGGHSAG